MVKAQSFSDKLNYITSVYFYYTIVNILYTIHSDKLKDLKRYEWFYSKTLEDTIHAYF